VKKPPLDLWERAFSQNRGKILGSLAGLAFGLLVMSVGLLWTLFLALCIAVGYFVGRRLDEGKEDLIDVLDRLLPPGHS
jgi:uncharacterized membrane protein